MTAVEKLAMIEKALGDGRTVRIATALRAWDVDARCAGKWLAAGRPLFKISGTSLMMGQGRSYVCIDYCAIRVSRMA